MVSALASSRDKPAPTLTTSATCHRVGAGLPRDEAGTRSHALWE